MNQDVYGLTLRTAVRKRRMRRLRAIAALLVLLVIWLGFSVVNELAAAWRAQSQQQAAVSAAPSWPARTATPAKQAKRDTSGLAAVPLDGVPAPADAVPEAVPDNFIPGAPVVVAPANEVENGRRRVPFQRAALNGGAPGYSRRGPAGFGGGMGSFGGGGFGGGSQVESDAVDDSGSGDARVSAMGRRAPEEVAGGDDTGSNGSTGNGGSNDNNGSNGSSGSNGNNGSNGSTGSNGPNGSTGTPSGNAGDNGEAPAGDLPAGGPTANGLQNEGEGSRQAVRTVPEPGSILLALGAAAAIVRYRRRRG